MRRSNVVSLPPQLEFPGKSVGFISLTFYHLEDNYKGILTGKNRRCKTTDASVSSQTRWLIFVLHTWHLGLTSPVLHLKWVECESVFTKLCWLGRKIKSNLLRAIFISYRNATYCPIIAITESRVAEFFFAWKNIQNWFSLSYRLLETSF